MSLAQILARTLDRWKVGPLVDPAEVVIALEGLIDSRIAAAAVAEGPAPVGPLNEDRDPIGLVEGAAIFLAEPRSWQATVVRRHGARSFEVLWEGCDYASSSEALAVADRSAERIREVDRESRARGQVMIGTTSSSSIGSRPSSSSIGVAVAKGGL